MHFRPLYIWPLPTLFQNSSRMSTSSSGTKRPLLNPSNFPRPPALEPVSRHLEIKWDGAVIASTRDAFWVLETYHPPTYYLPRASMAAAYADKLVKSVSGHASFCEWKGRATYWDLALPLPMPNTGGDADVPPEEVQVVRERIWSYENPTKAFALIKDYLSFYAGPWQCFVDGEEVVPQPGDFYGGWTTSDIDTKFVKGAPGTRHW